MRIKTAEWVTASLPVDISYRCSSCGKENLDLVKLQGVGSNSAQAQQELEKKLKSLLEGKSPYRFLALDCNCSCRFCRHQEPWGKLDTLPFTGKFILSVTVIVLSFMVLLVMLLNEQDGGMLYGAIAACAASIIWFLALGKKNRAYIQECAALKRQQIDALPPQSLPVIMAHSPERHQMFNQATGTKR